jgi:hypothetical protein
MAQELQGRRSEGIARRGPRSTCGGVACGSLGADPLTGRKKKKIGRPLFSAPSRARAPARRSAARPRRTGTARRAARGPALLPRPREVGLLGGGFPRGGLSEIAGPPSSGRTSLALALLAAATARGEVAALVDAADAFDPPSAEAAGVALARLLWVRPPGLTEAPQRIPPARLRGRIVVMDSVASDLRGAAREGRTIAGAPTPDAQPAPGSVSARRPPARHRARRRLEYAPRGLRRPGARPRTRHRASRVWPSRAGRLAPRRLPARSRRG